jgi:hypothetical protein
MPEPLRGVSVGRLAGWVKDHPDIFPVNSKVDHASPVFRTGEGPKPQAALGETPVALEADGVNADCGVAWSAAVKGQATPNDAMEEVLDTFGPLLFPWYSGRKDRSIRIVPPRSQAVVLHRQSPADVAKSLE